jgi:hypothetical protein
MKSCIVERRNKHTHYLKYDIHNIQKINRFFGGVRKRSGLQHFDIYPRFCVLLFTNISCFEGLFSCPET